MSQLPDTESNGKGTDSHDGVGTGITGPGFGVEISSPALDFGCGGVGGRASLSLDSWDHGACGSGKGVHGDLLD